MASNYPESASHGEQAQNNLFEAHVALARALVLAMKAEEDEAVAEIEKSMKSIQAAWEHLK